MGRGMGEWGDNITVNPAETRKEVLIFMTLGFGRDNLDFGFVVITTQVIIVEIICYWSKWDSKSYLKYPTDWSDSKKEVLEKKRGNETQTVCDNRDIPITPPATLSLTPQK